MERKEMYIKIKELIDVSLKGEVDMSTVTEETDLIEELGISSILGIEILVRIENEFGIEVDDDDLDADLMRNLTSLAEYIEKQFKTYF